MDKGFIAHARRQMHPWSVAKAVLDNTVLGLLGGLQIITIVWMYLIAKVAYRVVTGQGAEDVRSDESDEE